MKKRLIGALAITAIIGSGAFVNAQDEEDVSVEALYQKAVEQNMSGQSEEASKTFEKMFDLSGGIETLFEDYGAQAGGLIFDYGMTLLPQSRWQDAKEAFTQSVNAAEIAKKVETVIKNKNPRAGLAKFQLGFCEAQLGNHEEAIRLYDEYLASNPPQGELEQVRNSFKLRRGSSMLKLGRVDEGIGTIQELFDNREAWQVGPQFLMQGILELGLGWVEMANAAGTDEDAIEKIAARANEFLDKNGASVQLAPLDQFRYGFVDRLKKLGYESTRAGLYSLALRYFSFSPTISDVRDDINMRLSRLPIGSGVPSQYQQMLDRLDERDKAPFHPDAETLRLSATCYERLGNNYAARAIYWYLSEHFPDLEVEKRGEILHEAARFSSQLGDYPAAQYFGDKFMAELPEEHKLRNNVSTFMLQSLFTSRQYDLVIEIGENVRAKYELGDNSRELADALYPLALYSTQQHEKAEVPFDEYTKSYDGGSNREMVLFHRASNSLILGKMRVAAEQIEDFLKEFPSSERFIENALADLAVARYNLEDYPAAIAASDRLEAAKPESMQLARTLNIEGDGYLVMSDNAPKEQEAEKAEWRQKGLEAYLAAIPAGKKAQQAADGGQEEYYKTVVAEAIWKATDINYTDEKIEEGLALYDQFFPDYAGTFWEPQISVFSLEPLESADRGEEGLTQVEKMINVLGNKPPEEQDLDLLRQAIGSYSEASVRIRGVEPTVATFDAFPGLDPANQALNTWLKIQKVIVLQESRKGIDKGAPEYAAVESRIAAVFEELRLFEKRNLSEFALQQIGLYLAKTNNPFLAVPYFDELLSRTNEEADAFKAPAEMAIADIEARSPDAAKIMSARERYRRVIDKYKTKELIPDAHLSLARLHMKSKEWKDALVPLQIINKDKKMFSKERVKRAEAGLLMGIALDEMKDPVGANRSYLAVVSTYGAFPDYVTQAWEKYIPNSLEDIAGRPEGTPEEKAKKREAELALYRLCTKYLFMWQKWTDEECPSGALRRLRRDLPELKTNLRITEEEQAKVEFDLGLPVEEK